MKMIEILFNKIQKKKFSTVNNVNVITPPPFLYLFFYLSTPIGLSVVMDTWIFYALDAAGVYI